MSLRWPFKDPDEVLDYGLDYVGTWSEPGPLFGSEDIISNSLWVVPAGISKESDTHDNGSVTIWLSGGSAGEAYDILNRITTAAGRVLDQTVTLSVNQK